MKYYIQLKRIVNGNYKKFTDGLNLQHSLQRPEPSPFRGGGDYDALNRIIKEVDALGHEKTYAYDESGNLIEMTDTLGNKYTREYDLLGRVTKEIDPLGNETSYTYSRLGEIETITDAAGRVVYDMQTVHQVVL